MSKWLDFTLPNFIYSFAYCCFFSYCSSWHEKRGKSDDALKQKELTTKTLYLLNCVLYRFQFFLALLSNRFARRESTIHRKYFNFKLLMINLFIFSTLYFPFVSSTKRRWGEGGVWGETTWFHSPSHPDNTPFWNKLFILSFVSLLKKKKIYIVKDIMASSSKESTNKRYSAFSFHTIFLLLRPLRIYMILLWVHVKVWGDRREWKRRNEYQRD